MPTPAATSTPSATGASPRRSRRRSSPARRNPRRRRCRPRRKAPKRVRGPRARPCREKGRTAQPCREKGRTAQTPPCPRARRARPKRNAATLEPANPSVEEVLRMCAGGWRMGRGWLTIVCLLGLVRSELAAAVILDDFETLTDWTATVSSPGVKVELASDPGQTGMAMRIDFNFESAGGHVLVRKPFAVDLPANYAFLYAWRGTSPAVDIEFKLIDRSEKNVWWYRQPDVLPPSDWTVVRIKKPRLAFAWGPLSGGAPRNVAYVELAITGALGDRGSVWIDDLRLEER